MNGPRRILLVNAYVRENAGDAALLSISIAQTRQAFPGARLVVAGMEDPAERPSFEGVANIGSIRRWVADGSVTRTTRVGRRLVIGAFLVTYLVLPRAVRSLVRALTPGEVGDEMRAIATSDVVVSIGGGYVNAAPGLNGLQNLVFALMPMAIAEREHRGVVMMPQSFGPFRGAVQRRLVRSVLSEARLVCAREDISLRALRECGLNGDQVVAAVDSGFAVDRRTTTRRTAAERPLRVGMTARRWLPEAGQAAYERAMARVADELADLGHEVVLIPQVTTDYLGDDDRTVNDRIVAACRTTPRLVDDRADYRARIDAYSDLDLLVGTRFHSVIFALCAGVPCVAVAYEHKTRGIMRTLGLEHWVIDMADTVDGTALSDLVARALVEREEYATELAARIPDVVAEADQVVGLLRDALGPQELAS